MKKLMGTLVGMMGTAALAAPNLDITCLRAGGYYGGVRILEKGNQVAVTVKDGLALHPNDFLRQLGVPQHGFVSRLQLVVPASSCDADGPLTVRCETNTVKALFRVENGPVKTVILHHAIVELLPDGTQIRANISAMRRNDKGVDQEAAMTEVFETPDKPVHSACRAN